MKRILLIAYAYPPYPIVGSIRAQRLAEAFLEAGHRVHVVTARLPDDGDRIRVADGLLTVETAPTWPHPKDFYRWLKRKLRSSKAPKVPAGPRFVEQEQWKSPEKVPAWKRYILSMLHVPDELQGFILPAVWRGVRAFQGGPDLIYTTSPPSSSHLAGLLLRAFTRARWIAEFRDPWVGNEAKSVSSPIHSPPADAMNRWLERRCLRAADRVVTVTHQTARMIGSRMDGGEGPLVALNGIERVLGSPPPAEPPFRILYVGGVGSGRDPLPFFEAVAALADSMDEPERFLRVDFVGNCRYFQDVDLQERSRRMGLGAIVSFTSWVVHEEAKRLQERADLLLLLAQRQPAQVPNKLYEYLGANRPILALADEAGESAAMLRQVGGHFLVTERDDWTVGPALREAFARFRDGTRFDPPGPDPSVLDAWMVDRQMRSLLEQVDSNR